MEHFFAGKNLLTGNSWREQSSGECELDFHAATPPNKRTSSTSENGLNVQLETTGVDQPVRNQDRILGKA
jgi:hypothetical protein